MSFEEVGEAQMLSVHHSFEGAVLAAWKACNEHGYQDDFSQHVEDDSDISDLEQEYEPANKIEALKAAVLQRAELQGTSLFFDLETEYSYSVPASFTIELHHIEE